MENEEEKKKLKWPIILAVAMVIIVIFIVIMLVTKPTFKVGNFNLDKETTNYTTIDNTTTYRGTCEITTSDTKNVYIVAVKITKTGGTGNETYVTTTIVSNGKGDIGTYDYGDEDEIIKPEYKFEVVGYTKFKK